VDVVVPEPSTLFVLGSGLIGILAFRLRPIHR
jgi:PEP-CTERM motif